MKFVKKPFCMLLMLMLFSLPLPVFALSQACIQGEHQDVIIAEQQPTETQSGYITYQCALCDREYTDHLPPLDDPWGPWVVDQMPGCTTEGLRHRRCSQHDHHVDYDVLPALGHRYQQEVQQSAGVIQYRCSVCGHTYTEALTEPKEPDPHQHEHEYEELIEKPATCTEEGTSVRVCTYGDVRETRPIPAIGHRFGAWLTQTDPSAKSPGLEYRVCENCGMRQENEIPMLASASVFNFLDLLMGCANLGLIGLFAAMIMPYFLLFGWHKEKQEAYLKRQEQKRLEEKQYDFH